MRFKVAPRVAWQTVDDEAVLVDLVAHRAIGLNPSGTLIWSMITDHDEGVIVDALVSTFAVEAHRARTDLRDFVTSCVDRSFLVPDVAGLD